MGDLEKKRKVERFKYAVPPLIDPKYPEAVQTP
jgi:hypothetical protein